MKTLRFRYRMLALALPLVGISFTGCWDDDDDDDIVGNVNAGRIDTAVAEMGGYADSGIQGTVSFHEEGDSLLVTAEINGLNPGGTYGMHIHEFGDCSTPEASGDHFKPGEPHGNPFDPAGSHHAGDLPNVQVDSAGVGRLSFMTATVNLEGGSISVLDRSVVLHALPDDYITQPAGGTGERIACGVIVSTNGLGTDTTGVGTDTTGVGIDTTGIGVDTTDIGVDTTGIDTILTGGGGVY